MCFSLLWARPRADVQFQGLCLEFVERSACKADLVRQVVAVLRGTTDACSRYRFAI